MKHPSGFTVEQFKGHVSNHTMQILCDEGIHRHLTFSESGSSNRHFHINTWPGYLCFSGDMGCFVFQRTRDMFCFFRSANGELNVNPSYWSEKVEGVDQCDGMKTFFADSFHSFLSGLVKRECLDESTRQEIIDDWDGEERTAYDICCEHDLFDYEPDFDDFTYRYLWALHAIVWAIGEYDRDLSERVSELSDLPKAEFNYGDSVHVKVVEAGEPESFPAVVCGLQMRNNLVEYTLRDSEGCLCDGYTADWLSPRKF